MEWRVETNKSVGITWIENEEGETVCDLYYRKHLPEHALMEDYCIFDNAKTNAELIAKAPHQQTLIAELVEACKTMLRLAEGEELDIQFSGEIEELREALAKAEKEAK